MVACAYLKNQSIRIEFVCALISFWTTFCCSFSRCCFCCCCRFHCRFCFCVFYSLVASNETRLEKQCKPYKYNRNVMVKVQRERDISTVSVNKINYLLKSEKRLQRGKTLDSQQIEVCANQFLGHIL